MGWNPLALCDAIDECVCVLDGDGNCLYSNPAALRVGLAERLASTLPAQTGEHYDEPADRWYRIQARELEGHRHVVATDITEYKHGERRLAALARASQAFARALDLPLLFEEIARSLADIVGDGCLVRTLDETGTQLRTTALHHVDPAGLERYRAFFGKPLAVAEGLAATVFTSGQPLLIAQLDRGQLQRTFVHDQHRDAIGRSKVHSVIAVPLRDGERRFGLVMMLRDRTPRAYSESDLALLQDLADRASLFVENARVLEAERLARQSSERIATHTRRLQAVTAQLSHRRPACDVAETILRESAIVLGEASGAIWLLDESRTMLDMLASVCYPDPARFARLPLAGTSPLCASVREDQPVYLANVEEYTERFPESASRLPTAGVPIQFATACLPLTVEGRAIGGVAFAFPRAHTFDAEERAFLEVLANQCAQAIDRSRLFEQERSASEAARDADRRKDEFLALLGHELRNPLAPILTALDLMRFRGERGSEHERALIERQTRHLVRLVDDLLDISRITRGKLELQKARTDLAAVVAHAVEMASPLLEQRGHHLAVSAQRGTHYVDGDELRLAQVFQNLLTNAAKYTPHGGSIAVRVTARDGKAVTEIKDSGDGIPAALLPKIFDPFVQGERTLDRSQGGLGIGLALVQSLVTLHGGTVEAHSAGLGWGSEFIVSLPLSQAADARTSASAPVPVPRPGLRRRVLLVDDNRDAAEMLAALLREAGHEVLVAYDGPSALTHVAGFDPDVALLDIGLPVMDGYDLAARLRTLLPNEPRLVAITGYGQEHDRRRSREAGFAAHLIKPVDAAEILAAVDDVAH